MRSAIVYSAELDAYDLGPDHPLRPERVRLAVALMDAYGLIADGMPGDPGADRRLERLDPRPATAGELSRVHDAAYIDAVVRASGPGGSWPSAFGIGPGDTPAFPGMHDAASRVAGATCVGMEAVLGGGFRRALCPAGGLHHAHRSSAAGFCVYNDVAVAIAAARAADPGLRVLYLDLDAHHGDGVQEAFYTDPRVLTISLHEDGRFLYPGTGSVAERGPGPGAGAAVNVPLPPLATGECYLLVIDEIVAPAARAFAPGMIVVQCGADAHWSDPLTSLSLDLRSLDAVYRRVVRLASEVCDGTLLACGGGGYSWLRAVPRAWTLLGAALTGVRLPDEIPAAWIEHVRGMGLTPPESLYDDPLPGSMDAGRLRAATEAVIDAVRRSIAETPVPTP